MRLNIGCGGRRIAGYTGVDAVQRPAADIIARADKIPLPSDSVDEIMAIHLFEHFYRWECETVISEWKRLLKVGGTLVLELPNLQKCCENILSGRFDGGKHPDQLSYWGLYGDPRQEDQFMAHRWGWTPDTLRSFLTEHGFADIAEQPTLFHPAGREHRDMRIVARRA
jgi:predicted SAM-dependent methyltransferase